jgi:ABC-type Mn2+/Zn2+ transport system ATPase subunit
VIHKLTLTGFGKFRKAEFELSGVTLVFGPNEAGKTTFFDGIFQALCRPSETKKSGKVLKARYGAARSAQAVLTNDIPITDEEFMNLYAIREGDLRLELDKGTEWLDKLKSRLFHGGLDPSLLAGEFEKRSSDSRTLLHNKELEKAREVAVRARQELDARRRDRDNVLSREKTLADTESALRGTLDSIREAAAELAALEKDGADEDRISLRQKLSGHLARLEDCEALEAEAKALAAFREDRRDEFDRISGANRSDAAKILSERGKREQQADLIAQARVEARTLSEAKDASGARSAMAMKLRDEAREALSEKTDHIPLPVWSLAVLMASMGLCAGAAVLLTGTAALGLAVLGLVIAVASVILGLRAKGTSAAARRAGRLSGWKDRWALTAGSMTGVGDMSTLEGFLQAMETFAREREDLEGRERDAIRRLDALRETLEKIDASLAALKDGEESSRRAEREWLLRHGVDSIEEYSLKVARRKQLLTELPRRRGEIEAFSQGAEPDTFRRELRRKLQILDEEGIPGKGLDDAALQRLRRRQKELREKLEELRKRELELIGKKEGLAGEIRGALGKLAGEIVEWEDRLALAEEDIKGKELDKRAAALALDIFREIGDGADLMLAGLSREMETMLGNILPAGRTVSLTGLEDRHIQVKDAGGGNRALDHLSTGTKHAMVLAAKLAMALKHRQGPGILVLDEPFLAMDDGRETRALELLRDFHDRHGWQIILMTKEVHLKDKVLKLFTDPRVLDLSLVR